MDVRFDSWRMGQVHMTTAFMVRGHALLCSWDLETCCFFFLLFTSVVYYTGKTLVFGFQFMLAPVHCTASPFIYSPQMDSPHTIPIACNGLKD